MSNKESLGWLVSEGLKAEIILPRKYYRVAV